MATSSKSQGALLDWTALAGSSLVETGVLDSGEGLNDNISGNLHVVMCHKDTNANTGTPGFSVLVRVDGTDEGWRELVRLFADPTTATTEVLAANSGNGQVNPERIEVADTTGFTELGKRIFLLDAGDITASCLVTISAVATNDYIQSMDDLVNAYDTSDSVFDIVDEWTVALPDGVDEAKVVFFNDDADSTFAVRVDYSFVDSIA